MPLSLEPIKSLATDATLHQSLQYSGIQRYVASLSRYQRSNSPPILLHKNHVPKADAPAIKAAIIVVLMMKSIATGS